MSYTSLQFKIPDDFYQVLFQTLLDNLDIGSNDNMPTKIDICHANEHNSAPASRLTKLTFISMLEIYLLR